MADDKELPPRLRGESDASLLEAARAVWRFEGTWREPPREYPIVRSFSCHPPKHRGDKFLVVLKGYDEEGEIVAFYKGTFLMGAIAGALRRLLAGKVEWKRETPWKDRR